MTCNVLFLFSLEYELIPHLFHYRSSTSLLVLYCIKLSFHANSSDYDAETFEDKHTFMEKGCTEECSSGSSSLS